MNRIVSSSKESIIPTKRGWASNEVTLSIKSVLVKLAAMVEYGIAKKWQYGKVWRKHERHMRDFERFDADSSSVLNVNDNIGNILCPCCTFIGLLHI